MTKKTSQRHEDFQFDTEHMIRPYSLSNSETTFDPDARCCIKHWGVRVNDRSSFMEDPPIQKFPVLFAAVIAFILLLTLGLLICRAAATCLYSCWQQS